MGTSPGGTLCSGRWIAVVFNFKYPFCWLFGGEGTCSNTPYYNLVHLFAGISSLWLMTQGTRNPTKGYRTVWLVTAVSNNCSEHYGIYYKEDATFNPTVFWQKNETGVHLTPKDSFVEMAWFQRNPDWWLGCMICTDSMADDSQRVEQVDGNGRK